MSRTISQLDGFLMVGMILLLLGPLQPRLAEADHRIRSVCGDAVGYDTTCGGEYQVSCDPDEGGSNGGPACDSGFNRYRHSPFSVIHANCPWPIPNETFGVCYRCGAKGEPACGPEPFTFPPQRTCDAGLVVAPTSSLSGSLSSCSTLFPDVGTDDIAGTIDGVPPGYLFEDSDFSDPLVSSDVPAVWELVTDTSVCADAAPVSLTGASREPWGIDVLGAPERGTVFVIHGRRSRCPNVDEVLAEPAENPLYDRNQLVYCIEYDQVEDPLRVRILPVAQDTTGAGPASCVGSDSCSFDIDHPVVERRATTRTVEGLASALSEAILNAPVEGEITLLPHSGGGFLMRALLHRHYDELRWRGRNIARVMSLGHPYFGVGVDPALATPWVCVNRNARTRDLFVDCATLRWLNGWQQSSAAIDGSDFPQIEWTAIAGDGFEADGTTPAHPAKLAGINDSCTEVFGGVNRTSVVGDDVVPILSSLGIDEFGFFPNGNLEIDDTSNVRCDHDARCLLREALRENPDRVPVASLPRTLVGSGALDFDGNDEIAFSDASVVAAATMFSNFTLEAWLRPDAVHQEVAILSKGGEYDLGLIPLGDGRGELAWALGADDWNPTGFVPPLCESTHVALSRSSVAGVVVYANGVAVAVDPSSTGSLSDEDPSENALRIGAMTRAPAPHVEFTTSPSAWAQMAGSVEILETTAPNVLLANEITSLPDENEQLCGSPGNRQVPCSLTFQSSNTGLCRSLVLSVSEGITFDDNEFDYSDALSIGDVDNGEDDDFRVAFTGANYAFGFTLLNTGSTSGEEIRVHGAGGHLIASYPIASLVDNPVDSVFIGLVANEPISWVDFDEGSGGDDIAIRDLRFDCDNLPPADGFDGRIEDVRVWRRALSQSEVVAGIDGDAGAGNLADLAGWWRFDEASGDTLFDSGPNLFDTALSAQGAGSEPSRRDGLQVGRFDRALYFDGVDDYVAVTDPAQLSALEMTDQLTVEAWIFPRTDASPTNGAILNKEGEYALVRWSDGRIAWALKNTTPGWTSVISDFVAPTGVWTHVSFTYDSAAGEAKLYANGLLEQEWFATGVLGDHHGPEDELRIGSRTISSQPFYGVIDEVRLWNVARNEIEIAAHFDRVVSPDTPGLAAYWAFDEEAAGVAFDQATGYHAALGGGNAQRMPTRNDSRNLTDKPVPEPGSIASLCAGVALLTLVARRRRGLRAGE